MADRWKAYFGDEQLEITVHENGRLSRTPPEIGDLLAPASGPARIAFLGTPAIHKGWGVFLELAQRGSDPAACRFYHFGDGRYRAPNVVTRVVNVVEDGPLAMVEALRRDSIDLALVWSLWEESFSYTAHEALAAGVAILTNTGSGNIARVVATPDDGLVFGDESELYAAIDDGVIPDLVDARRKDRGRTVLHLSHSRMTADLVTFDD
jgi:glycosyltransferase involved in cell wall biosynthesis